MSAAGVVAGEKQESHLPGKLNLIYIFPALTYVFVLFLQGFFLFFFSPSFFLSFFLFLLLSIFDSSSIFRRQTRIVFTFHTKFSDQAQTRRRINEWGSVIYSPVDFCRF